jgi:putative transposase
MGHHLSQVPDPRKILLYMFVDVWSRKIVGHEVHSEESAQLAAELIQAICITQGIDPNLVLHADNGGPMRGSTMVATLERLGVLPSFSRPHVSDDNPYSEALFRTLKYRPSYPNKPFGSLEHARTWVRDFVCWYNEKHLHSAIRFVTPSDRHDGRDKSKLAKRQRVYEAAKARKPLRWSGATRNWQAPPVVWLNQPHSIEKDQPSQVIARREALYGALAA